MYQFWRRPRAGSIGLLAACACVGLATSAKASVTYDTTLAAPGVYFGSGNINQHWTVSTQNGVELGLQALIRYVGPVTPQPGSSVYNVPTGINATHNGALWDFAFSANVNGAGLTLGDITTTLTLTDEANGTTGSINPFTLLPDNAGYVLSGSSTPVFDNPATTSDYGFQNSEPLAYSSNTADALAVALGDSAFNADQNDTYLLTLSATCSNCEVSDLGSVSVTIVAGAGAPVPEPRDLAILGVGLLGLAVVRRGSRRSGSRSVPAAS